MQIKLCLQISVCLNHLNIFKILNHILIMPWATVSICMIFLRFDLYVKCGWNS